MVSVMKGPVKTPNVEFGSTIFILGRWSSPIDPPQQLY
jgi:hypothetical protein